MANHQHIDNQQTVQSIGSSWIKRRSTWDLPQNILLVAYITVRSVHLYPAGKSQPKSPADNPRPGRAQERGGGVNEAASL